jgi:hypothetical protein
VGAAVVDGANILERDMKKCVGKYEILTGTSSAEGAYMPASAGI